MSNPFAYWEDLLASWQAVAETGVRLIQASVAAEVVFAARGDIIRDAIVSPASADHAELARILPEKAVAFGEGGTVLLRAWLNAQTIWWDQAVAAGRILSTGRTPSTAEFAALWSGAARASLRSLKVATRAGRDAVEPVARAVDANARRLRPSSAR